MIYPFNVVVIQNEDDVFWVARSSVLPGVVGQGNTAEEAIAELTETENGWLETAKKYGDEIPEVPMHTY